MTHFPDRHFWHGGYDKAKMKVVLPADVAVDAEVDLGPVGGGAYELAARLKVSLPGSDVMSVRASWRLRTFSIRIPAPHTATSWSKPTWSDSSRWTEWPRAPWRYAARG